MPRVSATIRSRTGARRAGQRRRCSSEFVRAHRRRPVRPRRAAAIPRNVARRSARARRAPARPTPLPSDARRTPTPGPRPRRATARRPRCRRAVALPPRLTADSRPPDPRRTDPVGRRRATRTRCQAHRVADREGAPADPGTAHTDAATPRRPTPSPTRLPSPWQCRTRTRAAPDTPNNASSCRRRPPRATPAPGSDHCAHSPPAHPTPRTRCDGQAAAAPKGQSTLPPVERKHGVAHWQGAPRGPGTPGVEPGPPPGAIGSNGEHASWRHQTRSPNGSSGTRQEQT